MVVVQQSQIRITPAVLKSAAAAASSTTAWQPLLHVGNTNVRSRKRYAHIIIEHLVLDGSTVPRDQEMSVWGSHIRNSGIILRCCDQVLIRHCIIRNCASGGIVPQHCTDVTIEHCLLEHNVWDGIAPFDCKRVRIRHCTFRKNGGAGISLDGFCVYITISHNIFADNRWQVWSRAAVQVRLLGLSPTAKKICLGGAPGCGYEPEEWQHMAQEVAKYPL